MKRRIVRNRIAISFLLALIVPIMAACGGPATPAAQGTPEVVREPIAAATTPETDTTAAAGVTADETTTAGAAGATADETATAGAAGAAGATAGETATAGAAGATAGETATAGAAGAAGTGAFSQPHPILGDIRVRQALAYCTNRPELLQAVYPFLEEADRQKLVMDSNVPQGHWALADEELTRYPFDAAKGQQLLDDAGWTQEEEGSVRANADGAPLVLKFLTTNAQFRQTWAAVFEQQMLDNCGIQIIRTHAPGSFVFGDQTGIQVRDYELAAYAWVGEPDPGGLTLYACNQIPLPSNNWEGQNSMGWCNETASKAIIAANNTLDREERIRQYAIFQEEFTKDMVSLPLFNRSEVAAANPNLVNFKPNPTEYYTYNAGEWELEDGGDSVILGFTQEPASMFALVESAAVQRTASFLIGTPSATTLDYDYQAVGLTQLPSLENGGATNENVDVEAGDMVWNTAGEAVELANGVEVVNADGETVTYDGGALQMKQLKVTFEYVDGIKWEDGEPLKQADFELAAKINCDPESGATSFAVCESIEGIEYASDAEHTITYLPGVQWPEYQIYTVGAYPSHQVLSDGRNLADVPASEWATLPEIAETPLSNGPFKLVSWEKGQSMTFEANENYHGPAPKLKQITIQFFADTNQAVAQLLTGDVDALGTETLGAGPEVETVLQAAEEGTLQAVTLASPTWEHIDMNLFEE